MSGSDLPFVGEMVIVMCICKYFFKYKPNIKYKHAPFCDFQYKYKNICIEVQIRI